MKKIQDIISGDKKPSIRDVSINRDSRRPHRRETVFGGSSAHNPYSVSRGGGKSFGIWFVAFLAVLFLFFSFTILFSGSKVVVTQKTESLSFETNFQAVKGGDGSTLSFDTLSISDTSSRSVASSGEEFVETKASGTIVVYNEYSSSPQKLIENTRFESPTGLIYRIKDPITVPGFKTDSSGKKIPGSMEVVVYADKEGSEYNISQVDFTIPGLKGTPQYESFYARSKTDMTGGFVGAIKKVAQEDRASAVSAMQAELREKLIKSLTLQLPEGYVLYDGAMDFDFESQLDKTLSDDKAELVEKGTVHAIVFNTQELSQEIARVQLDDYNGLPVEGVGIESLLFVLQNKESATISSLETIDFSLKGSTVLVWTFDENALKEDLVNKRKRDMDWVLNDYPSITNVKIVMRPFWKRNFPDNAKDIKISYTTID